MTVFHDVCEPSEQWIQIEMCMQSVAKITKQKKNKQKRNQMRI